jgi:hypothetical protein
MAQFEDVYSSEGDPEKKISSERRFHLQFVQITFNIRA